MKTFLLTLFVTISALTMPTLAAETSGAALVSEIIPIKYAMASEIADALNSMKTNSAGAPSAASGPGAISSFSNINLLCVTNFVASLATNAAGSQPSEFGYAAMLDNELDALLTTFASDSRVKILQRPRIQTSDGVTATLFVGESRPSGSYSGGGATCGDASIQQISLGVTGVTLD